MVLARPGGPLMSLTNLMPLMKRTYLPRTHTTDKIDGPGSGLVPIEHALT